MDGGFKGPSVHMHSNSISTVLSFLLPLFFLFKVGLSARGLLLQMTTIFAWEKNVP